MRGCARFTTNSTRGSNRVMGVRRRVLTRTILIAIAALAVLVVAALPPASRTTPPNAAITTLGARGAYHVHTVRSDGSGTPEQIAADAAAAGLQFVILTDHGDGTRVPDPPRYVDGVLLIDAVELSTTGGHYVAIGMPVAPYPIAGAARDVVDDVHRFGGFGIAAHPGSLRPQLSWSDWSLDIDGVEWLNSDSEWRDESWSAIARSFLTYPIRGPESLAALLDRPSPVLARWDAAAKRHRVVGLAGADAHARLGLRQRTDPDMSSVHAPLPSYRAMFRTFSNHVELDRKLSGDAEQDASAIVAAIREGRVFTVIDALASPGAFAFDGSSGDAHARMGADLPLDAPALLHAHIAAPEGTTLTLLRDGQVFQQSTANALEADITSKPGVYRVEATLPGGPDMPWLVSNPIYAGFDRAVSALSPASPPPTRRLPAPIGIAQIEKGGRDASVVSAPQAGDNPRFLEEQTLTWQYSLGPGIPAGQFAAISIPVKGGLADFDRVQFEVKADRPMRLWVQMRAPVVKPERWGATFYAGTDWTSADVAFERFTPIGIVAPEHPPLATVDTLLIVADTLNVLPGSKGTVQIRNLAYVRQ